MGIGCFIGNYLKQHFGFTYAFFFGVISALVSFLYALVLIPPIDDDANDRSVEAEPYTVIYGVAL